MLIFEGQTHSHNAAVFLVFLSRAKWKALNGFGNGRINHCQAKRRNVVNKVSTCFHEMFYYNFLLLKEITFWQTNEF